ncbi:hypothetical protein LWI29_032403 [Acer saccharum]|uniref:Uncharacterized protein n=1 Tax=Acer saccharum TaxID=4024 RepID=A0AA39VB32_ACESA|nr:hypothetical protein LWI29_032403 [Acer saccharum]
MNCDGKLMYMISPGLNSGNHQIPELSHCEYSVLDRFQRSSGFERRRSELGVEPAEGFKGGGGGTWENRPLQNLNPFARKIDFS